MQLSRECDLSGYTLVNPVQITKSDELWRASDQISAVGLSTEGRLEPADSFPQSTEKPTIFEPA
ncbi:MAG: hypothetical protein C0483_11385 [Pirellula sp.]|nr:hypothetical protein [Pirellula sp.]